METNLKGMPLQDDLGSQPIGNPVSDIENNSMDVGTSDGTEAQREKHHHHEDHHVNRKYRMFSNHSSANDMPHTNTSF